MTQCRFDERPVPGTVTVPASYLRGLLAVLARQGHDVEALVAGEGLGSDDIAGQVVPAAAFGRLYQQATRLLQDESMGIVSDGRVVRGTFRMLCLSVIACEDVAGIVRRAGEFLDIARGVAVKPALQLDGEQIRIGFAATRSMQGRPVDEILAEQGPLRVRSTLFVWRKLLDWFVDRPLPVEAVRFTFPSPDAREELERWTRMFNAPVVFDADRSELVLPRATLEWPNVQNERSLQTFLQAAPYHLMAPERELQSLTDRVLGVFGGDLSESLPSAEETGRRLGLSVSTLRRHLLEEGTSFQALKDECRRTAAFRYLAASELTLADIAALLGFDDPSAFFRAFKRWTGTTPARYRDGL